MLAGPGELVNISRITISYYRTSQGRKMNVIEHVGSKIREFRSNYDGGKGISQEGLAKAIGVATNTISRWETATYKPSIEDLEKIARFFNVSILEFFPEESRQEDSRITPLLRAAKGLPDDDLEELRRYAEFRRARYLASSRR